MSKKLLFQTTIMALLLAAYAGLVVSGETAGAATSWYTHLAYPPIVLAGLWWGRRALIVPALLAVASVLPQFIGAAPAEPWGNLVRLAAFLAVGLAAGLAGEMLGAARAAVRMSEAKYRQLAEKSLAGIFVYRDDLILYINTRLLEMLGYSLDQTTGKSYWDFVSLLDRPRVREIAARRENQGVADLRYECRLVTSAGKLVIMSAAPPYSYASTTLPNGRKPRKNAANSLHSPKNRKNNSSTRHDSPRWARWPPVLHTNSTSPSPASATSPETPRSCSKPASAARKSCAKTSE
ncbi:MAG: PAS domain S-box protein [Candidatus Hydrogenedentes bacterium]|nr:PAS domain S-box protein [Candidatus Hydrogenedentota bacterium]